MNSAPIVLFVYNRPWHTAQTLHALAQNELAGESVLYVFADGPKDGADAGILKQINETRDIVNKCTGFKKVFVEEQSNNMGLAEAVIYGVTKVVNEHGKLIVLEDDIVTAPGFLMFMNEALNVYEADESVGCISAYIYPVKGLPSQFFIKGADCWGWAAWKRSWANFERDGGKLLNEIQEKRSTDDFDFFGTYPYTQMLQDQIDGKNNSWAIRWYASLFLLNQLCFYPGVSYVRNIGLDGSGTHCAAVPDPPATVLNVHRQRRKLTLKEDISSKKKIAKFFKGDQQSLLGRIFIKIRSRAAKI